MLLSKGIKYQDFHVRQYAELCTKTYYSANLEFNVRQKIIFSTIKSFIKEIIYTYQKV